MSNSLAIAAATATVRNLLGQVALKAADEPDTQLSDTLITTLPLDKAGSDESRNQINLYLYQIVPNAALRNADIHARAKPTDSSPPPLALNLHYMITPFGRGGDEILSHRLIGRAMGLLHANPVLPPAEITAALPGNTLGNQIELVRITPWQLTLEEISKVWNHFQTKYRLSVTYQVAVILIDTGLPVSSAPLGAKVHVTTNPQVPAPAPTPPPAPAPTPPPAPAPTPPPAPAGPKRGAS